jgi:sugar lactone lactonase YvrE
MTDPAFLAFALIVAGCMQSNAVPCGDRACEAGDVCTPNGCASQGAIHECVVDNIPQLAEGAPCTFEPTGYANKACLAGACMATTWRATATSVIPGSQFPRSAIPTDGVVDDGSGNLYIADAADHRILRVDASGAVSTIAGTGVAGFSGDQGPAMSAQVSSPSGVALDAAGNLYIADTGNNRIRQVVAGVITTIAGTGGFGFSGEGGEPALAAQFRAPAGLVLDPTAQQLFIADAGNHIVRAIDLSGGAANATIRTIAGTPQMLGLFGDCISSAACTPATDALLFSPQAITTCAHGDLLIADTGNNRVRRVAAGAIATVLGDGTAASSGAGQPATEFPVDHPLGLACDSAGNLFVTSTTTVRIVAALPDGTVDGSKSVQTIYDPPQPGLMPASQCMAGLAVIDASKVLAIDSCAGTLVELDRELSR